MVGVFSGLFQFELRKSLPERFMDLLTKAVPEAIDEVRRRDSEMTGAWMKAFAPEIKDGNIKASIKALIELAGWSEADAVKGTAQYYDVSVEYVNRLLHPEEAAQ